MPQGRRLFPDFSGVLTTTVRAVLDRHSSTRRRPLRDTGKALTHLTQTLGEAAMNRFLQVKEILDNAVGGPTAPVGAFHGAFWRELTRDEFMTFELLGLPIVTVGDGDGSTIVKALRGQAPFGADIGTPEATMPRMPAGGLDPVPDEQISVIAAWIYDGCPAEDEQPLRRTAPLDK
jgi:hypothetical protein